MLEKIPGPWKVAALGATLGIGVIGFTAGTTGATADPDPISLRDRTTLAQVSPAPARVASLQDDDALSPDGESFDSPLQSPDDSPEGGDSVDTPGPSPDGESADSPGASPDDSIDGQASADTPGESPDGESADSPGASADDSIDGQASVDSPDDAPPPAPEPVAAPPPPAPAPAAPPPRPAPAADSYDSPASADSPDGASFDS